MDYLKLIPKTRLCGWIHDNVRKKWERLIADERSGVHYDLTAAKQVIENWNVEDL